MPLLPALCLAAALLANAQVDQVEPPIHVGLDGRLYLSHGANPHPGTAVVGGENLGMLLAVPARFHRLEARVSLGGIFYLRPIPSDDFAGSRYRIGGVFLDELFVKAPIPPLGSRFSLTAGWFRWKTNPDAVMAGEYLARYSAYPTKPLRHAMPWDSLDSLTTPVSGIRLSAASPAGRWGHSALVLMDSGWVGSEISLVYSLDAFPIRGLEIGLATEGYRIGSPFGSSISAVPGPKGIDTVTFTHRALLLSMRAALDLKAMISEAENPSRVWRVFAEAAMLGWKNQPQAFESRRDRLALMAGVHLPSFDLLDALTLQWESIPSAWERFPMTYFRSSRSQSWLPSPTPAEDQEIRVSRFHLIVSKRVRPWIGVQAWFGKELDAKEDTLGSYRANQFHGSHPTYELRLVGRF